MNWYKKAAYEDFDNWEDIADDHKDYLIEEMFDQGRIDAENPDETFEGLNTKVKRPEQTHITWEGNYILGLAIPREAVDDIARIGANDEAVDRWHKSVNFKNISDKELENEVSQHGLSDNQLSNRQNMEKALLWMASHDISEQPERYGIEED